MDPAADVHVQRAPSSIAWRAAVSEYEPARQQTSGELLARLPATYWCLAENSTDMAPSVREQIALELTYDGALVRLCHAVGVDRDLRALAQPVEERLRLERALLWQGIDVDGLTGYDRSGKAEVSPRHGDGGEA